MTAWRGLCRAAASIPVDYRASLKARGKAKAVHFQNGTWAGWRKSLEFAESEGHQIPPGPMSDSRAAWLCSIYGHRFLERCEPFPVGLLLPPRNGYVRQWHSGTAFPSQTSIGNADGQNPLPRRKNVSSGQASAHKTKLGTGIGTLGHERGNRLLDPNWTGLPKAPKRPLIRQAFALCCQRMASASPEVKA